MELWIDMALFCLGFVLVLISFVTLLQWILDRIFGVSSNDVGVVQQMQANFFLKADVFAGRKARKSKTNPHYDKFVDAEWQAQHEMDKEKVLDR